MKVFNQVITVEVDVDSIFQDLLKAMNPEAKHAEIIAEAIIGSSLEKGTLNFVYNALNGHLPDINFKPGDAVICNATIWGYKKDSNDEIKEDRGPVGLSKVLAVNPYAENQIQLEYTIMNSKGEYVTRTGWYSKTNCDTVPVETIQATL